MGAMSLNPNPAAAPVAPASMQFDVLRSREDIRAASDELRRRGWLDFGLSLNWSRPVAGLRQLLGRPTLAPNPIKGWDVLRVLEAVTETTTPQSAILDLGSVACPVLPCLHRLGYLDLHGVDLEPNVLEMPFAGEIDYRNIDMTATPWPDGTFAAITAVSVIEHGFNQGVLLDEVARLLRPGGAFIFSTDYWPRKIANDIRLFGLDWRIFSAEEIEELVESARERKLYPIGDPGAALRPSFTSGKGPIACKGKRYSFLYGALLRGEE